jgi:hypothetical protein
MASMGSRDRPRQASGPAAVTCSVVDGRPFAVTAGHDRIVRVRDMATGEEIVACVGHDGPVFRGGVCPAPGLMETSNTRRIHSHGGTTEVPGRVAGAGDAAGG